MAFITQARRNNLWFGTLERADWFPTPMRGADVSPSGWSADGTLLNGGGFQLNSFGSHKQYIFEWGPSSSREVAQLMKSYSDGTYGRGLIYFVDPLIYDTNILPAMWADPSMGIGFEGASLVYGLEASGLPTSNWKQNNLPVRSAYYNLQNTAAGWRGTEHAVFLPIPDGYNLALGSFHSQTGNGGVFYREQSTNGALGAISTLTGMANNSSVVVDTVVSGSGLAGVWVYVGKSAYGAGSVTLTAMTARLIPSVKIQSTMVAQNLFTNPNLVGDGTWAEIRRNHALNPSFNSLRRQIVGTSGNFSSGGSAPLSVSSEWSLSGDTSLKIGPGLGQTSSAYMSQASIGEGTAYLSEWAGKTLTVSATIRLADTMPDGELMPTNSPARSICVSTDVGGVRNWAYAVSEQADSTPGVTRLSVTFTLPSDVGAEDFWFIRLFNGSEVIPVWWDDLLIEETPTLSPYFDGSTTPETAVGVVQPEDFRWRWLGLQNESESVMEIENVAGLTAVNSVAGVASREGKPAVRIIPNSTNVLTYAWADIPVEARSVGTAIGTIHLDEPLAGSLDSDALSIHVHTPTQKESAQNIAGEYPLRLGFSGITSGNTLRLYHGGSQGSGDVWWTDIGLFAGDYDGPAFSGDSGAVVINGKNLRTQWDGTSNNSTSSAWTTTPALVALQQGPWIGGQGHSGCRFIGKPTYVENTGVNGGQVGFAASFREIGSWLYG